MKWLIGLVRRMRRRRTPVEPTREWKPSANESPTLEVQLETVRPVAPRSLSPPNGSWSNVPYTPGEPGPWAGWTIHGGQYL